MSIGKFDAKIIGLLFILPLFFYGIGNSLVEGILVSADPLTIPLDFKIGGFLMILNSITVTFIGVLLFPILKKYQEKVALTYLTMRILEAVILIVGIIGLFTLIPLEKAGFEPAELQNFKTLIEGINFHSYQIAMIFLGFGSIPFCYLMYKQKLIPAFLALWGCVGYALLLAGSIGELFGYPIGVTLAIPGGLFEIVFGFWLIIKGFRLSN